MARAAAEVGSTANSYQILAKLAAGGMAEIFLARGEGVAGVERYCVLKRILRERASDVQFVRMFLDEARLAAQLQHPNIAQVHDIGKLGDSYFFTMEYVHGETVRALLHRALGLRRNLPIASVLTIVAGAAAGLHHAHVRVGIDGRALGIVHRDVSPSNLMVSYEGSVKLVDFGVAKAADRAHETKSGTVKGKISYLSPEQCRGKRVDRRSDLFSLGICFWEMLTTERLYRRDSDFENMNAIVSEAPPPPSSRRADIPAELDELVLRLLAKDPDDRCQSADELVEIVEAVAARVGAVVSASALGRLMRELFGQRPEPWIELESLQAHGDAVTVAGEPIPSELALPAADRIAQQLSSVLDLSPQRSLTSSVEELPAAARPARQRGEPTAQISKPAKRGFPLAAPPPTSPGVASSGSGSGSGARSSPVVPRPPGDPSPFVRAETVDLAEAGAAAPFVRVDTQEAGAAAAFVRNPTLDLAEAGVDTHEAGAASPFVRSPTLDLAEAGVQSPLVRSPAQDVGEAGVSPSRSSSSLRTRPLDDFSSSSAIALPAPPSVASPSRQAAAPGTSASFAAQRAAPFAGQGTGSAVSAPFAGPGPASAMSDAAAAFAAQGTVAPSSSSSFSAQGAAAAASSGAFAASPSSGAHVTPSAPFASLPAARAAARPRRAAWPLYAVIAVAAVLGSGAVILMMRLGSGGSGAVASHTTASESAAALAGSPAVERRTGPIVEPIDLPIPSGAASDPPEPSAVAGASIAAASATSSPTKASPTARGVGPSPSRPTGAPRTAPRSGSAAADRRDARIEDLARWYAEGRYDKVLALCGGGPISADHAPTCFLAACHVGDQAAARRLLIAAPAARRDPLIAGCKQLGVDLKQADCEADPMSCQH